MGIKSLDHRIDHTATLEPLLAKLAPLAAKQAVASNDVPGAADAFKAVADRCEQVPGTTTEPKK